MIFMKKRLMGLIMCFALVLSVVSSGVVTEANETNDGSNYFTKESVDNYRQSAAFPTKDGYVFAGWYQDAGLENAISGTTPDDGAYAKFVDATVLSVKCQLKSGTTIESASTDLRLITSVDSLNYKEVGFRLEVNGKTASIVSKTVYRTIYGYVDGSSQSYVPGDVFSKTDSLYFMTKNVTNILQDSFETDILITPFWITIDGTAVSGTARTIKIGDELFAPDPLGFIAGEGTTVAQEIKDGETVVKAVLSGDSTQVYFKDVIAEDGSKGAFFKKLYQYVTFDMYIESSANFLFNTSTHNIWTNGAGYDWSANAAGSATQGDYLRSYVNGVRSPINKGAWYTVSMKVEDYSTAVSIAASSGAAIIYLKNLTFANAFPTETQPGQPDSLGFTPVDASTGSSVVKVTEGDFADTMMFTASSSGDEWNKYNRVTFDGIDCENKTGLFYENEWKRVEFQVYFAGGYAITPICAVSCWWSTFGHAAGDTNLWSYLTVTDAAGNSVQNVTSGQWYTFSFSATNAGELSLGFAPGAVAYFRNLKFTK